MKLRVYNENFRILNNCDEAFQKYKKYYITFLLYNIFVVNIKKKKP